MSDILEQWRSAKERWIISGEANEMIVGLETEIELLREALRTIADGDTPREHAIVYRSDGVHSKHDKCKHGAWMYDGCEDCVAEYARAALGEGKE
jgi:hypothetical protein